MLKETLICKECESSWNRKQVRGRKPRLCPQCSHVSGNVSSFKKVVIIDSTLRTPSIKMLDTTIKKLNIMYFGINSWHCPYCTEKIKTHVSLTVQPMHWCRKKGNTYLPLELVRAQEL